MNEHRREELFEQLSTAEEWPDVVAALEELKLEQGGCCDEPDMCELCGAEVSPYESYEIDDYHGPYCRDCHDELGDE
jgi:hypothetical protein